MQTVIDIYQFSNFDIMRDYIHIFILNNDIKLINYHNCNEKRLLSLIFLKKIKKYNNFLIIK